MKTNKKYLGEVHTYDRDTLLSYSAVVYKDKDGLGLIPYSIGEDKEIPAHILARLMDYSVEDYGDQEWTE